MIILIKNMVSARCIMVVKAILAELNIPYDYLELGELETSENIPDEKLRLLDNHLNAFGLELLENRKNLIVEKIKQVILELVRDQDEEIKVTLSDYLSQKLNYNSIYLSNIFSEAEGISIKKFYINKKIEHVKNLLLNDNINLKEISWKTKYSSVPHLSNQFKKTTGVAPLQFKHMQMKHSHSSEQVSY
jgi:YesN/AraC family two-component response regulator